MNDMSLIETPIGILEIHTVKDYLCKVQFMSETNQNRKIISKYNLDIIPYHWDNRKKLYNDLLSDPELLSPDWY